MKYLLFEKSAVEFIINTPSLQSVEFSLSRMFIKCLREGTDDLKIKGLAVKKEKDGLIFCGKDVEKIFLLFDLEKCKLLEKANDLELLVVLQKTFRFAVRFWNRQAFTNCERIFKNATVIFPFPYSIGSAYRIVLERNPNERRLNARGIKNSLLAYKYGEEGTASGVSENPDLTVFRKGGEKFLEKMHELKKTILEQTKGDESDETSRCSIQMVSSENMVINSAFKYMNYEKQIDELTLSQKKIVEYDDLGSPIRIEGPAGTGKTAALVLRAIKILRDATQREEEIVLTFFTHSKSTENAVKAMIERLAEPKWFEPTNLQRICVTTLQEFCVKYIGIQSTQIIDLDASEAKQYQLLLIQDALNRLKGPVFNTFKPLLSEGMVSFIENEEENKIVLMLQHEFSIRIKGMVESDLERYKKLQPMSNGIPLNNESDKEFIFRIFREYQQALECQSVYDTDDIILEALARLNAPLWRRARIRDGIDYLLVDEMHLFNLNEQQVFHFLTKDGEQRKIPMCFALDYGQVIGERGGIEDSYIENYLSVGQTLCEEFSTVFRSSQQIAELCASITASGALLFEAFVNPYKYCESSFTAREEELCETPKLIMYENDESMKTSLENHIKNLINTYKCQPSEIAVIFFDEDLLIENFTDNIGRYAVNYIDGRENSIGIVESLKVACSLPEYINGLEFKCVILVGVDEGRVPQNGIYDISTNFLKYNALNKLYLSCSRARYSVIMLGTNVRGESSCLKHSLSSGTLILENR